MMLRWTGTRDKSLECVETKKIFATVTSVCEESDYWEQSPIEWVAEVPGKVTKKFHERLDAELFAEKILDLWTAQTIFKKVYRCRSVKHTAPPRFLFTSQEEAESYVAQLILGDEP